MSKQDKVFKKHPNLPSYHETSDGVKFFKSQDAHSHARSLKDKSIKEVKNPNPNSATVKETNTNPVQKPTSNKNEVKEGLTNMQKAQLRADAIAKLETVEDVKEALKDETSKTVKKAAEERIKALELALIENAGNGEDAPNTKEEEE